MGMNNDSIRQLKNLGILVFIMVLLPAFIGYLATGFDTAEIKDVFVTYGVFGLAGAFIALIFFFVESNDRRQDAKYGDNIYIHSPGDSPSLGIFKFFKNRPFGMIFLFGLFFGLLALIFSLQGQTFTGEVLAEQQFSPTSRTLFLSFIVPAAENMFATGFAIVFLSTILRPTARKYRWSKSQFQWFAGLSTVLIFAFVWLGNHQLRYGSSDLSITIVFMFGALGGLLTFMTGSVWPFFMMHMTNNLFYTLNSALSNDSVRVFIIFFLLLQGVGLYFSVKRKTTKNE